MSEESTLTLVQPAYSILGIVEGLGGFAVVLIFLARWLVNDLTDRIFRSELLEKFYQVNTPQDMPQWQLKKGGAEYFTQIVEDKVVTE